MKSLFTILSISIALWSTQSMAYEAFGQKAQMCAGLEEGASQLLEETANVFDNVLYQYEANGAGDKIAHDLGLQMSKISDRIILLERLCPYSGLILELETARSSVGKLRQEIVLSI